MSEDFIKDLKKIAEKHNLQQYVVFYIQDDPSGVPYINFYQDSFSDLREFLKKNCTSIMNQFDEELN